MLWIFLITDENICRAIVCDMWSLSVNKTRGSKWGLAFGRSGGGLILGGIFCSVLGVFR